ncbi:hypothetical protein EDD22DRAFT_851868 [Suillus occidentalis]|nr:hypothetical protein EDD22DRAFT_851868 [Suillus occidentalis]
MADHDTIRLVLPTQLKSFNFTFECRRPGPVTVEISLQRPLKWLRSQHSIVNTGSDSSEMRTQQPSMLTHWMDTQEESLTYRMLKTQWMLVLDESITEPESEPEAATPPDFTIWYEANKHDLGVALLSRKRSEADPGQIGLQICKGSCVPNASSTSRVHQKATWLGNGSFVQWIGPTANAPCLNTNVISLNSGLYAALIEGFTNKMPAPRRPTNHLDAVNVAWLKTCTSIISHDSSILNNTITDVLHLNHFKLYDINLQVSLSSCVAVLGPNGLGKLMLVELLIGDMVH